jgi:hypothetical protein
MQERPDGDELVEAFARWAAGQRAGSAAAARSRERSLREQARASATWAGILVDLAEAATVVGALVAGQRRSGRLVGVGRDFCILEPRSGRTALVCLDAVSELSPDYGTTAGLPAGDRGAALDLTLMTAMALLAEERYPVAVLTTTGAETAGDLVAVGADVLTIRTNPPARRVVYVPRTAVALCELR